MANTKEQQLQAFARRAARVSRALWPTNVRRAIATNRMAQTRRRLIVTGRYWRRSFIPPTKFKDRGRPQAVADQPQVRFVSHFPANFKDRGRPQGAPPILSSTPALTMNVLGGIALILVGVSIVCLIATHLWLLLLFLSMMMAATFLLLAMIRRRVLSIRRLQQPTEHRSFPGILSRTHSPSTPMPLEPPLVRVLETFDLSQSDVEHFFNLPEGGNTGGYSLKDWKEAQTSLPRTVREQ